MCLLSAFGMLSWLPLGTPVYPINLGGLQVVNLGNVIFDRPAYHSERYILPVGYQSRRSYFSIKEPTSRCMYTCQILDGGDAPTVSYCISVRTSN